MSRLTRRLWRRDRADADRPGRSAQRSIDDAAVVTLLLVAPLFAWNGALLVAPPWLIGVAFLFGPFLGIGAALSLSIDGTDTAATFLFLSLVNAIVATAVLSGIVRFAPVIPFTTWGLAVTFDVAYVGIVALLWIASRDRLRAVPVPELDRNTVAVTVTCAATLVLAVVAAETKAATGDASLVVLAYLWLLVAFAVAFLFSDNAQVYVVYLATAGLAMVWIQALSTNGLYAVDGLETVRFARAALSSADVEIFDRRLYYSLTVFGFFPGTSLLTEWSPFRIAKYVVPTIAGLSLVGVYRLSREWLDPQSAFAAGFLLGFTHPFVAELATNYRSAVAFPVLVAFFVVLKMEFDVRRQAALLAYLCAVSLLHDTVGIFLVGTLIATSGTALFVRRATGRRLGTWRVTWAYALTGVGAALVLAVAVAMSAVKEFAIRAAQLVVGFVGITVGRDLRSPRTIETTVGSLNETPVELLRQFSILSEVGLMALGTALLVAGWRWRERLTAALPWHSGDAFHEVLLVANAAWFGVLVLQPVLGAPRVFLYASPLLVGLFAFTVRQIDGIPARAVPGDRSNGGGRPLSSTILLAILIFGFVTQTGLLAVATGGTASYPGLADPTDPELRYAHQEDIVAHDWLIEHDSERSVHVDKHSYSLFLDDPEIEYARIDQIEKGELGALPGDGCVFVRTNNYRSGRLHSYHGAPGNAVLEASPPDLLSRHDTVYTTGDAARIVC